MAGLYGKVPAHGDFVRRGLPSSFVAPWDSWLAAGIAAARGQLGAQWEGAWDTAPAWRFALPAGACGPDAVAGVMLPSQDQVGRRFPITLAALLPAGAAAPEPAWFDALEAAARAGLAGQADADALAAALPLPGAPILMQAFALPPILPAAAPQPEPAPLPWLAHEAPQALPDPAHPDDDVLAMLAAPAATRAGHLDPVQPQPHVLDLLASPATPPHADGPPHDDVLALLSTPAAAPMPAAHGDDPLALLMGAGAPPTASSPDPDGTLAGLIGAAAADAPSHPATGPSREEDGTLAGLIGMPAQLVPDAASSPQGSEDGTLAGLIGMPAQHAPDAASSPGRLDDGTLGGLAGVAVAPPPGAGDASLPGLIAAHEEPALALAGGDAGPAAAEAPDLLAETAAMGWPDLDAAHDAEPAIDAHAAAPPAPEGGGWWTRGGAHVPPMVWPLASLPDPADFAYLLEAAA